MLSFALMIFILLESGEVSVQKHSFDTMRACEVAKARAAVQVDRMEGVEWFNVYCAEEHTA